MMHVVTFQEAAYYAALQKYQNEIDVKLQALREKVPVGLVADIEREFSNVKVRLSCLHDRFWFVFRVLGGLAKVAPPGDPSLILNAISKIDGEIEKIDKQWVGSVQERERCIETGRTPLPRKELLNALICPLTKKPLFDAVRLPSDKRVNAYAIGYCFNNGKFQPIKDGEDVDLGSEDERRCFPEGLVRDFKTIELAQHFFLRGEEAIPYDVLYDKVLGGLYNDPHLLPCGHVESAASHYSCNTSCQRSYQQCVVVPHKLLNSFVEAYKNGCRSHLISKKIDHLSMLVELKLKTKKSVKEELLQLRKARELINFEENQVLETLRAPKTLQTQKQLLLTQRKIQIVQLELLKERHWKWGNKVVMINELGRLNQSMSSCHDLFLTLAGKLKELYQLSGQIQSLVRDRNCDRTPRFAQIYRHITDAEVQRKYDELSGV